MKTPKIVTYITPGQTRGEAIAHATANGMTKTSATKSFMAAVTAGLVGYTKRGRPTNKSTVAVYYTAGA